MSCVCASVRLFKITLKMSSSSILKSAVKQADKKADMQAEK